MLHAELALTTLAKQPDHIAQVSINPRFNHYQHPSRSQVAGPSIRERVTDWMASLRGHQGGLGVLPGAGGFMGEVLAELKGLAEAAQVPLQALCSLSLQYEAQGSEDGAFVWHAYFFYL